MNCLVVQLKNEVMCRTLEFLTDDLSIKVGDHIISPDFSGEMVVTGVTQAYSEYTDSGLHRRILRICKLNGKPCGESHSRKSCIPGKYEYNGLHLREALFGTQIVSQIFQYPSRAQTRWRDQVLYRWFS